MITRAQSTDPCDAKILKIADDGSCNSVQANITQNNVFSRVEAPDCGNYVGGDVWFKVIVPGSGILKIEVEPGTTAPVVVDAALALYRGTDCSQTLSLIDCDDDSGRDLMPTITSANLVPGETVFVRVWKNGGGIGSFKICASSPNVVKADCIGGENPTCNAAQPFCTDEDVTYCNISSTNLGRYSCLSTTPNAMWLYMEVGTSGRINITIRQTSNAGNLIDVDFALYGPYTDLSAGCPNIGPNTPTVDCSYSAAATEIVNIPNAQAGQTYVLLVTNFNGAAGSIEFVNNSSSTGNTDCSIVVPCTVETAMTPDLCLRSVGTVTATPVSGLGPYTYSWNLPGNPTSQTVNGVPAGTYNVTMTTSDGCVATAPITVTNNTVTSTSTSTMVSCPSGSDGTATATMTPALGILSYQWNDLMSQTTQTAVGLSAGTYTCVITSSTGCSSATTVTVREIPGMIGIFSSIVDASCNSKDDGELKVAVSQGTAPYAYLWDKSASTSNVAANLYADTYSVIITDAKGCDISLVQIIDEPDPLLITMLTPDTQICPEDDILLTVSSTGGSSQHIFKWYSDGKLVGTESSITVDPDVTNTQYCVEVTEVCGSPMVDSCMIVTFPTPIPPAISPNIFESCLPGEFIIKNISPNSVEIASTFLDIGNNTSITVPNGGDMSIEYTKAGVYTLTVINTSIYGCVYENVFTDYLVVHPDPISNFYIGGNPTTIFETTLNAFELASDDVVQWDWYSPYSQPSTSNSKSPRFSFPDGVEGVYPVTLVVTSHQGCVDTFTLNAIVEEAVIFYAPNAFTPDNDEFNQVWKLSLQGGDAQDFNLIIYNRWGEPIWETRDYNVGWDGTYKGVPVMDGTYTWKASIKNKYDDGRNEYNGIVTVIR